MIGIGEICGAMSPWPSKPLMPDPGVKAAECAIKLELELVLQADVVLQAAPGLMVMVGMVMERAPCRWGDAGGPVTCVDWQRQLVAGGVQHALGSAEVVRRAVGNMDMTR